MATVKALPALNTNFMIPTFEVLKNHRTIPCHIASPCKFSGKTQIICHFGRQRVPNPLFVLHSASMISRKNSLKSSSSSEGGSAMEVEAMVEYGTSTSATPSRGIGHHVNKLSKWAVSAFFAIIVIWRHDAEVMWAVAGSILNTCNSKLLKRVFKQQRPPSALGLKADPGMPSSHAQSLGYITIYAALSWISWRGLSALSAAVVFAILICGAYMAWLRVSEGLHSYDQVLVGALLGSLTAVMWFWLWKAIMLKAFTSYFWVRIAVSTGSLVAVIGFVFVVVRTWRFGDI